MVLRIPFAHWRSPQASGGNRYDDELVAGLASHGIEVDVTRVEGAWPLASPEQRRGFVELLAEGEHWLVDNIVGSAEPGAIRAATGRGARVTLLMHYFPADDPSLPASERARLAASEAESVAAATRVVVPSAWAAGQVAMRYGRGDAVVARPGVEPAEVADGSSGAPTLLWLSRLTDGKDPLTFVQALSRLTDLAWTARLVGPDDVDPDLSARVRQLVVDSGLSGRVTVEGARTGADLEQAWRAANLLVHTSRAEMYGMVVAEAAARGIPAIVTEATGATEARTAGAEFVPGDVEGLSEALRAWLSDGELRASWRAEALERRGTVPGWDQTVASVAAALKG